MSQRIKNNEMILENHTRINEIHSQVNELHKYILGNGQAGLLQEFNQMKGGIKMFKFLAGSGGIAGIIALLTSILR